ncbi:MAG: hypothetical protein ACXVWU_12805 [Nocardioides sp.]
MRRFRYPRGFGRLFALLFLVRHPAFILVLAAVALVVYLYRRRR